MSPLRLLSPALLTLCLLAPRASAADFRAAVLAVSFDGGGADAAPPAPVVAAPTPETPAPSAAAVAAPGVTAAQLKALVGAHQGYLPPERVAALRKATGFTEDELLIALLPIAKEASRPMVSGYPVGAVGLGVKGAVYFGGNLSFIGVPVNQGIHAEQAVVANARGRGETALMALAVTDAPCGHCRQFLNDLGTKKTMRVLVPQNPAATVEQLLPMAYVYADGRPSPDLLGPWNNALSIPAGATAEPGLLKAALAAANASHSKFACSGVALRVADGRVFSGEYMEVSGANPSVPPLQAALVQLIADGARYEDIREAVLVELAGARVIQADAARVLLRLIAPQATLSVVSAKP